MPVAELALSEGYHRAKRAAQAYAAVLIVLGLVSSPTVGWQGLMLPVLIARILVGAAAFFYAVIFEIEWRSAARRNSDLFTSSAADTILARLKELDAQFQKMFVRTSVAQDGAANLAALSPPATPDINALLHDVQVEVEKRVGFLASRYQGVDREGMIRDLRNVTLMVEGRARDLISTAAINADMGANAAAKANTLLAENAVQILGELKTLRSDFHRLGSRFSKDQQFLFNWLDRWATWVLFSTGTCLTLLLLFFGPFIDWASLSSALHNLLASLFGRLGVPLGA